MNKPLLTFKERNNNTYEVRNHEGVFVGDIEKLHVGQFFHWCLSPQPDAFFTNGCLKEVTEFITSLYRKDKDVSSTDSVPQKQVQKGCGKMFQQVNNGGWFVCGKSKIGSDKVYCPNCSIKESTKGVKENE